MSQFTPITQDQLDKPEVKMKGKQKTLVLLIVWSKPYEELKN